MLVSLPCTRLLSVVTCSSLPSLLVAYLWTPSHLVDVILNFGTSPKPFSHHILFPLHFKLLCDIKAAVLCRNLAHKRLVNRVAAMPVRRRRTRQISSRHARESDYSTPPYLVRLFVPSIFLLFILSHVAIKSCHFRYSKRLLLVFIGQ